MIKPVKVADIKIGDEVVVGDGTFVIHKIDDDDKIVRTLRDHRGIAWREPSRWDTILVWVDDPSDTEECGCSSAPTRCTDCKIYFSLHPDAL